MFRSSAQLYGLVVLVAALADAASTDGASCPPTIHRDVVVVGGGAGGCHAAFRLKEDFGKTVALVEKQSLVGGAVDTWIDPDTGTPINYGVQTWVDLGESTTSFFESIGVPYVNASIASLPAVYADFTTGKPFNLTSPAYADILAALTTYTQVLGPYTQYIRPDYFNFPQPKDIPEDLLLPFGQFMKKHGLEDAMEIIFQVTTFGLGDQSEQVTLFSVQAFSVYLAEVFLGTRNQYYPASGRNQDVYDAVATALGKDVFYSSTVIKSSRNNSGVTVTVQNHQTGQKTKIIAKKLIIAMEPTLDNMQPFDLDAQETSVLSKFSYSHLYTAIIKNSALPTNFTATNLPASAAPDNYLAYPQRPFAVYYKYFGDGVSRTVVVGEQDYTADQAVALMQKDFDNLVKTGVFETPEDPKLEIVIMADHGAMHSRVTAADLRAGFIQDLYALLGKKSTWYTGGAWSAQLQTAIWAYNDVVLPMVVDSM